VRLFFALWPPRETAAALHAWALSTQRATGGRATRAESIHLTLAFLGEIEEELLRPLEAIPLEGPAHALPIETAGYWKHNRIVWAGPRETPDALQKLQAGLRKDLLDLKIVLDKRPFAAHVTLIRKAAAAALPPLPSVRWPVEEVALVRSKVSPAGSSYETIARYPLSRG
jgi:2'-5' RNA ligase